MKCIDKRSILTAQYCFDRLTEEKYEDEHNACLICTGVYFQLEPKH